jgi:hypothetical protein
VHDVGCNRAAPNRLLLSDKPLERITFEARTAGICKPLHYREIYYELATCVMLLALLVEDNRT